MVTAMLIAVYALGALALWEILYPRSFARRAIPALAMFDRTINRALAIGVFAAFIVAPFAIALWLTG